MYLSSSLAVCLTLLTVTPALAQTVSSTPFQAGGRYFFTADDGTLYVREGASGKTRVMLSAKMFGVLAPSPDGKYLAYGAPAKEGSSYDVRILDVLTDRDLPEVLHNAVISRSPWTDNNKGFFYSREDTAVDRQRVYYHRAGQQQGRDEIIFSRQDELDWTYDVRVSDDGQYVVLTISHPQDNHTRLYFIDLDNPGKPTLNAPVVKLVDQFAARYTFIDNGGQSFFLQTDRSAPRGRVVLANTDVTRESRWPVVLNESEDTLQFVQTAGEEYIVAVFRSGTKSTARVYGFPSQRTIENEIRRRADSVRKAGGNNPDDRPQPMPRGGQVERPVGLGESDTFAWRLELKREIPVPANSVIVDMRSVATEDELFFTTKTPDGKAVSYVYNVKNGQSMRFDTNPHITAR